MQTLNTIIAMIIIKSATSPENNDIKEAKTKIMMRGLANLLKN
jgi:hypothetical protein